MHAIEKVGHDPRHAVTSNWPHVRDELIAFIEREATPPAYLVGHSLGGYLSPLAAAERPGLARGVVLLDSPVVGGWKARALQFAKATRLGERLSPGHVSKRRRNRWPSAEAAHAHFAAKDAFARFAPGVLADYIASGVEPDSTTGDVRLSFDRAIETAIYNALPHHIDRLLRARPLPCPIAFVGGSDSAELRQAGLAATLRATQGRVSTVAGSHLFPFEQPAQTAAAVLHWLDRFEKAANL